MLGSVGHQGHRLGDEGVPELVSFAQSHKGYIQLNLPQKHLP